MRTGKRNWILVLCVAGFVIFFVGKFSNNTTPEAVAAADTRTAMERYVSAYSQYTQAELDKFTKFQSAVAQSDWDAFWATAIRMSLGIAIVLGGYFGFGSASALVDKFKNKANIVTTPYGVFFMEKNGDGQRVPRPIDKPFETPTRQKQVETLPVYHHDKMESIEVTKDGKVIDVVEDAADFLTKAIRVNGHRSIELPRHESMGVSAEKWSSMVHEVLGGMFTVENRGGGVKTYCATYPDLASTLFAVKNKEVPLPEKKKAKK